MEKGKPSIPGTLNGENQDLTEKTQEDSHYHKRRNNMILLSQIATTSWRASNAVKWNPVEATERKRGQWRLFEPRNMHLN